MLFRSYHGYEHIQAFDELARLPKLQKITVSTFGLSDEDVAGVQSRITALKLSRVVNFELRLVDLLR